MATFKQTIEGMKEMEQPENQQPKTHQVTEAKVPEGRFLKDDPYYKLVADKKPKAYREHLFYPEGDKLALHGTAGERLGEFATEDEVKKFVDDKYSQNQPKADKKSLFDEYQLATPEGRKASSDFLKEMGVQNVHALTNEQYNDLARKAMERFGIDDFKLAQEFIQSNDESDRAWDERAKAQQPKQGSFQKAIGDIAEDETEEEGDYQNGAKTHSENEFRLEALNDRGMYDFISKNRDYLYRKANSDPQGAIRDILGHSRTSYGIKPENIRKEWAMDVLKSFYEDDESVIPDFTKQEEFKPSEQIEEYDDYYGAKTASERDLNLLTGNDRGAYDYVNRNRESLAREAEYDPASVLNKIKWHAENRNWARELKGDSIRKDYLIAVLKGIVED